MTLYNPSDLSQRIEAGLERARRERAVTFHRILLGRLLPAR